MGNVPIISRYSGATQELTDIVEALDAARPSIRPREATKVGTQRSVSVRERPEVQEVLRLRL